MGCVVVGAVLLFGLMLVSFICNFASDQYDSFKLWMRTSKKIPISAAQLGDSWPLTVSNGIIFNIRDRENDQRFYVIFRTQSGREYGVNGAAQSSGYADIHDITKSHEGLYTRYDEVDELISIGLNANDSHPKKYEKTESVDPFVANATFDTYQYEKDESVVVCSEDYNELQTFMLKEDQYLFPVSFNPKSKNYENDFEAYVLDKQKQHKLVLLPVNVEVKVLEKVLVRRADVILKCEVLQPGKESMIIYIQSGRLTKHY